MLLSSSINRHAEVRDDEQFIQQTHQLNTSQTLVWRNGEVFSHSQQSYFFSYSEIQNHLSYLSKPIYLGKHSGISYFTCHLENWHEDFSKYHTYNLRTAGLYANEQELGLLFYSLGLLNWHRNHGFCGKCGASTKFAKSGHSRICSNSQCAKEHFPRIEPAVIFSVENRQSEPKLLLARQANWDENRYSVLAGFVEPGESLEQAVAREGFEEVGLNLEKIEYVASQPWPFPSSLMLGFESETTGDQVRLLDQELEKSIWVTAEELVNKIKSQELKLPYSVSISWFLIDRWFTRQTGHSLKTVINQ